MQAGLEHLSWAGGTLRDVDHLWVVVEPQAKSMRTAARTIPLARELGITEVALIGNRLVDGDRERVTQLAADHEVAVAAAIPEDGAVRGADRVGRCLLDHAPDSPSVRAIEQLAGRLGWLGPAG